MTPTVDPALVTRADKWELTRLLAQHEAAFEVYFADVAADRDTEESAAHAFDVEVRVCDWLFQHGFSTIVQALAMEPNSCSASLRDAEPGHAVPRGAL